MQKMFTSWSAPQAHEGVWALEWSRICTAGSCGLLTGEVRTQLAQMGNG
jgi:hypothetical protein